METIREQIRLAQQGDGTARERLVTENTGLIWSVVKRFYGRGHDPEDLFQIGVIGLLKAIDKFDFQYDVRFSTYAVPMILGEIRRFLRDDGMIKVSRPLRETAIRAYGVRERLMKEKNREITLLELAEAMEMKVEELVPALEAGRDVESLSSVVFAKEGEKGLSLEECIPDERKEENVVERILLQEALEKLPPRERQVILLRYFEDKTQTDIARRMGISQVQVSRIEKKVLQSLRKKLSEG
ncbi:SigB/SigF/SigG family RNA polymerase sigma factor [Anaerotignum lactatifermentans]|uniref:RNA polymerase sigma factor n=1 Tax=Anaerotignum lactatifermentans TaxID=160404 RepID=A0ABS2G9G5_9FIRM|nr:SigB/SigF/SigG family RNA polymerase sigma factor [Anaerotignum lactatifermentans]MBM6828400.1 SigB/SigF/SigG family RNA polymerase sigma factor [Anaerotignum lactatifermentans]MBM6877680.1 SigB/SigF/SigG family RNA polymerase sigma factor [Anaerotignum lactatifermentans]MBM6949983.1 SigB/SigF/SigG family RNA polymerase sigma factor [Anaerotignum lactatifermentans]